MLIAKIENNAVTDVADYRQFFPKMGYTPDIELIKSSGFMLVQTHKPHDIRAQKLELVTPYIVGDYVYTVDVVPKTQQDLDFDNRVKSAEIRQQRDRRLKESDWTQIPDATVDRAAWQTYRAALRDITSQQGFPWEVTWPVPPDYISYQDFVLQNPTIG